VEPFRREHSQDDRESSDDATEDLGKIPQMISDTENKRSKASGKNYYEIATF